MSLHCFCGSCNDRLKVINEFPIDDLSKVLKRLSNLDSVKPFEKLGIPFKKISEELGELHEHPVGCDQVRVLARGLGVFATLKNDCLATGPEELHPQGLLDVFEFVKRVSTKPVTQLHMMKASVFTYQLFNLPNLRIDCDIDFNKLKIQAFGYLTYSEIEKNWTFQLCMLTRFTFIKGERQRPQLEDSLRLIIKFCLACLTAGITRVVYSLTANKTEDYMAKLKDIGFVDEQVGPTITLRRCSYRHLKKMLASADL